MYFLYTGRKNRTSFKEFINTKNNIQINPLDNWFGSNEQEKKKRLVSDRMNESTQQ